MFADGTYQSTTVTAGAVEHFAIIGKIAEYGTIDRAVIEPGTVVVLRWKRATERRP